MKPTCTSDITMSPHEMELHQKDRARRNAYRAELRHQRITFFIRLTLLIASIVGIYFSL